MGTIKLPFDVLKISLFGVLEKREADELAFEKDIFEAWIFNIKKQARENLNNPGQSLRINWQARWKKPMHESFDDYTAEEAVLEAWEQYYLETPDNLELKGLLKKTNIETGFAYFETGDKLIDDLEIEFSKGLTPNLSEAFIGIAEGPGQSIFQAFEPTKHVIKSNPDTKRLHTDFKSDSWIEEDQFLKEFASKMGLNNG